MARQNILLLTTDQHRADTLGYAGHPHVRTPHLDALAAESTIFQRAYCTTPLCMPSRTTLMTGQYAQRHGVFDNRATLGVGDTHLAGQLRAQGYQLGLFGKNHCYADAYLRTWDAVELYGLHGKETHNFTSPPLPAEAAVTRWRREAIPYFEAPVYEPQPGVLAADPACMQTDYALRFLAQREATAPFFLYLSYEAPHFPYVLPEPFFAQYSPAEMPGPIGHEPRFAGGPARLWAQYYGLGMEAMTDDNIRRVQASYLGMVSLVDAQIGRVLRHLRESRQLEHTIIVFTSDHGDFFGHHGLIGKTNALYEDLLRIPLLFRVPGMTAGAASTALVENTDLLPTLLTLLDLPVPAQVQGRSMAHLLPRGAGTHRARIVAESSLGLPAVEPKALQAALANRTARRAVEGPGWFINLLGGCTRSLLREDGMKLITHAGDAPELYDLATDPHEVQNLTADPAQAATLSALTGELASVELG